MKNILFTFICILFTIQTRAQTKGTVVNEADQKPIPYVNIWVENENIGTTADENGKFQIAAPAESQLIFNALGYENKIIKTSEIDGIVFLIPKVFELEEIKVTNGKILEKKVGSFLEEDVKNAFANMSSNPVIYAKYFAYDTLYQKVPYLKSIKTNVFSYTKKTVFNIRLYNKNDDGSPGSELTNQNILVAVKKGKTSPEINVTKLNIPFPENGLFVGLEALIIETNRYEMTHLLNPPNFKPNIKMNDYSPHFNNVILKDGLYTWMYSKGKWEIVSKNWPENHMFKYSKLAIELTLTN